ncbi:MAG TPA: FAD-dependent monooxygenase, partial [Aeromicrobium sp.]|nr:FAD-dependent monooxygenase [Aeromicrobium sp.]
MKRAVVLGGSVAGLCAAGALAEHFDEVVILERDVLPADAQHRRGVPQSKHPHFVLNSGRRAMNELFPGFEDDLVAAGGMLLMPSYDAAYLEEAGWAPRKRSTMTMVYTSRVLIERVLRDKVRALPNVRIEEGVTVRGLQEDAGAVTGVEYFQSTDGAAASLPADFVVDALGRGSSVSAWLEQAGWPAAPVKTLDAKVTYVSRWYDLPTEQERPDAWWWRHIVVMPAQDNDPARPDEHAYLSNFFPIDGNRAIACLGSWGLEMPRTTEDFTASAERLRTPVFAAAMKQCTPTSEVHLTRSTGNTWRRYDQVRSMPAGLVFVGDSICAFNPFYAQGMSSASSSAVLLKRMLAESVDAGFARRFTRAQVDLLKVPWGLALA